MEGLGGSGRTLIGAGSLAPDESARTGADADAPPARPSTPPAALVRRPSSTLGSTRIRIVVTYLVVLVAAALVSMIAIREVLLPPPRPADRGGVASGGARAAAPRQRRRSADR